MASAPSATEVADLAMDDPRLWNFEFGVEVSARYHEWRRATLEKYVRAARGATLLGAIITLLTAFAQFPWAPAYMIAIIAILIAAINLGELIFDLNERALEHKDLYRRFKTLQEKIARHRKAWAEHLPDWEAEAQAIRRDEPPTMWAVYAMCWNQTIERHQAERKGYFRRIGRVRRWLANLAQFSPQDFPAEA